MPKVAAVQAAKAEADKRGKTVDLGEKELLAVDPGDVHVGVALFVMDGAHPACAGAWELTPDECADLIARKLTQGCLYAVAYERFQLYADKALEQTGSEMLTSELIGVIKWLIRCNNQDAAAGDTWAKSEVGLWTEGAHIKKAIRAQLKARGIERVGQVGSHSGDAEEQGWYHLYRRAGDE